MISNYGLTIKTGYGIISGYKHLILISNICYIQQDNCDGLLACTYLCRLCTMNGSWSVSD